ncbi:restriction endonuclease subunit S [Brachybacterium sp. FME24]|uniref:restriction endonuclease subunit S n=1 Tax=Brachybacterium sp. FME24 TaxID=2742605 RepID=UPI001868B6E3|nr:restriction endonuclease subunit S [Brachybacterium sp. FME24]
MSTWETITLGDIATFTSGATPSKKVAEYYAEGTVPWITGADIFAGRRVHARIRVTEQALAKTATNAMPAGTIALVTRTSVGKVGVFAERTAYSQDITAIVPSERVDRSYLVHFLESKGKVLQSESRGATIKGVTRDVVANLQLPVPDVEEQRRIASILDETDSIRAKRRAQLVYLDELPQALFNETSSAYRSEEALANVATFFGGGTLPEGVPFEGQAGGTLLAKVSDMNLAGNEKHIHRTALWTDKFTARATTMDRGAVILPKRGAAIATNKKRISTRRSSLDPNLMGVMPNSEVLLTEYLFAWFCSFDLSTITSGSSVPQLNKKDLAPLVLAVPPLADQQVFAEKVTSIHTERDRVARALEADDELFAALQHRAFRGEL